MLKKTIRINGTQQEQITYLMDRYMLKTESSLFLYLLEDYENVAVEARLLQSALRVREERCQHYRGLIDRFNSIINDLKDS